MPGFLSRLFGAADTSTSFHLTLTHKGEKVLQLNHAQFTFMRDTGVLSEAFLQKIAQEMPRGGKRNIALDQLLSTPSPKLPWIFACVTVRPSAGNKKDSSVTLDQKQLELLMSVGIVSQQAITGLENALRDCRRESFKMFNGGCLHLHTTLYQGVSVDIDEGQRAMEHRTSVQNAIMCR